MSVPLFFITTFAPVKVRITAIKKGMGCKSPTVPQL